MSEWYLGVCYPPRGVDWCEGDVDKEAERINAGRPHVYGAKTKTCVTDLLFRMEQDGELNEGVIIRDAKGMRFKWKTKKYLALHRLKDNGNILLPRRLVDIVLTGETSEVRTVMPEVRTALAEVEAEVAKVEDDVFNFWHVFGDMSSQKKFALKVKDHPFAWVLFQLRKKFDWKDDFDWGPTIRKILLENSRKVSDTLFGKKVFDFDMEMSHDSK